MAGEGTRIRVVRKSSLASFDDRVQQGISLGMQGYECGCACLEECGVAAAELHGSLPCSAWRKFTLFPECPRRRIHDQERLCATARPAVW